jgi:hypothetical protein
LKDKNAEYTNYFDNKTYKAEELKKLNLDGWAYLVLIKNNVKTK